MFFFIFLAIPNFLAGSGFGSGAGSGYEFGSGAGSGYEFGSDGDS